MDVDVDVGGRRIPVLDPGGTLDRLTPGLLERTVGSLVVGLIERGLDVTAVVVRRLGERTAEIDYQLRKAAYMHREVVPVLAASEATDAGVTRVRRSNMHVGVREAAEDALMERLRRRLAR